MSTISPHHPSVMDLSQAVDDSTPTCEIVSRTVSLRTGQQLSDDVSLCGGVPATGWVQFTSSRGLREKFTCEPCLRAVIECAHNTVHRIEKL